MLARPWFLLLVVFAVHAEAPPGDLRELMRGSLARLQESDKKLSEYTFVRAGERKEFTSSGVLKTQQSWVVKREFRDGFMFHRLLERNGKPIPEEEQQRGEQAIAKRLAELKAMAPEQLEKMRAEGRRRSGDEDAWLQEFPEALDYKLAGEETIHGRPALVLEVSPRPGYKARNMRARVFEKVRGRVWIDKTDSQLVKAEAEVFETVNIALGLMGRIEKGTRFSLQRRKVADEAWLPETQTMKFAARVMLVKSIHQEQTTRYSDYRPR